MDVARCHEDIARAEPEGFKPPQPIGSPVGKKLVSTSVCLQESCHSTELIAGRLPHLASLHLRASPGHHDRERLQVRNLAEARKSSSRMIDENTHCLFVVFNNGCKVERDGILRLKFTNLLEAARDKPAAAVVGVDA